jgi:hypothetical protein
MLALLTDEFIIRSMQKLPHSPGLFGIEFEHMHNAELNVPQGSSSLVTDNFACHTAGAASLQEPEINPIRDAIYSKINEALESLGIASKNTFLSNGGRLYRDPSGLETATAETTTAAEATLRSLDESWLVYKLLGYLQQKDVIASFSVNRKAVDHSGFSRGIHLNTCIQTEFMQSTENETRFVNMFTLLNLAKGAMFGSGGLVISRQDGRTHYFHSPRLACVTMHKSKGRRWYAARRTCYQ